MAEDWIENVRMRDLLMRYDLARLTRLWLTRQAQGDYMLSAFAPLVTRVRGADHEDVYLRPGDPIGLRHMCPAGTAKIFELPPKGLRPLEPQRVELVGRLAPDKG